MIKTTDLGLFEIKKFLKLSKSPPKADDAPYHVKLDPAGWYDIYNKHGTVVGQAFIPEFEMHHGYRILEATNEIEYWEHFIDKRSKHTKRPMPAPTTDTQLDLVIANYVYAYLDKPGAATIHNTQLLSALLELKALKALASATTLTEYPKTTDQELPSEPTGSPQLG